MIVLSYAITKSGSTLALELCKALLEQKGFRQRLLPPGVVRPGHRINFVNRLGVHELRQIMGNVESDEIIAVKAHIPIGPEQTRVIQEGVNADLIKVQINHRDPREVCLSLIDAGARARERGKPAFSEIHTLADAAKVVKHQLAVLRRWSTVSGALHLHYNDVAFDTRKPVDQMCKDFGFSDVSDEDYAAIRKQVLERAFTQKNKAVRDRHRELSDSDNAFLFEQIPHLGSYLDALSSRGESAWASRLADSFEPAKRREVALVR